MEQAEIETVIKIHTYNGDDECITIKDNPDAPEIGFIINRTDDFGSDDMYFWKKDIDALIKAIQMYKEKE